MGDTRRSSIVFRFEKGKSELDIRPQQDIGRLANYVSQQSDSAATIYVVGFTVPLSYLAPVICNENGSAASKAKNRGVEVWVQK